MKKEKLVLLLLTLLGGLQMSMAQATLIGLGGGVSSINGQTGACLAIDGIGQKLGFSFGYAFAGSSPSTAEYQSNIKWQNLSNNYTRDGDYNSRVNLCLDVDFRLKSYLTFCAGVNYRSSSVYWKYKDPSGVIGDQGNFSVLYERRGNVGLHGGILSAFGRGYARLTGSTTGDFELVLGFNFVRQ